MDEFCQVSPGDPLRRASACRENNVSELLNRFGPLGPRGPEVSPSGAASFITCFNDTDKTISALSFVTVGSRKSWEVLQNMSDWIYNMSPGTVSPCGVLLQDCPPGETAEVQMSGLCTAASSPSPPGVLKLDQYGSSALYLLNSTGCDTYNNYFKVVPAAYENGRLTRVRIIDGGNPESGFAGPTDLYMVPASELETLGKTYVCLKMDYDPQNTSASPDGSYFQAFEMSDDLPSERKPYMVLAEIRNEQIIQRWTGGRIYWRNRFVVRFTGAGF